MEQTATGSSTVPQYTSKLQELLTADRSTLRSDFANASNTASLSRGSTGDDGTKFSDAVPDEYRNPRKRLLLSSMYASESEKTTDNQNEKGKKIMKKTEVSTGEITDKANEGPDSFKVAPLILKKYYPSAVQSAEREEFLVSLTAEDSLITKDPFKSDAKDDADKSLNGNSKSLKYDYEYMGAQIDKLLGMSDSPSSSSSGNKAAWKASRRQRRHQCEVCPKSYSTEDDLKSHILSHSEGENAKPFECEHCDKKFKWVASLKVHKRKVHKEMRSTPGTEDENESSEGEESSPSQGDTATPDVVKGNAEAASKSVPPIPSKLSLQEQAQSFESVVSKMLSSGLVSHNQIVNNTVEKSLPPRRKCSTAKEKPEAPSRRSMTRKDSKSSNSSMKDVNDAKRKIKQEEPDESPSPITPNRTSLRRNIQRPKWLTDADLVTDYEFPRGTNIMRTGNGNSPSPSTSTTPTMNGNQAKARTASTESNEDSGKNQKKSDRGKIIPPPTVERVAKDDGPAPKVVKTEPKKETVKKEIVKKVIKNEPRKKRITKAARAAARDAPIPNEPVALAGGPAPAPPSPSPTKQLSTKILSLSLNEENNEEAAPPVAAPEPDPAPVALPQKNSRKRPKSESPKAPKGAGGRKKPKRKLAEEVEDKKSKEETSSNATVSNLAAEPTKSESSSKIMVTDAVVNSEKASNSMSVQAEEGVQPKKSEDQNQNTGKLSMDTTDAKKMEEAAANVQPQERVEEQVHTSASVESISAQNNEIVNGLETTTKTTNSIESSKTIQNDNSVLPINLGSNGSVIETQKIENQILATAPFSFFNCQETVTFADLAKGTATIPKAGKSTDEVIPENIPIVEESTVQPEVQDLQEGVNGVKLPNLTNDEEMPVLKPEASSSAAVSRSESFAERMESIDEDVSNSSNHSIVPQHAPVLSKEAIPANGVVKIPMDCKTVSSESTVIDQDEQLRELPMIEGEEEGIGMRRDRSDSLSMRSCGSGSPSEKIKTLDDAASKDKEKADMSDDDDDDDDDEQECLPDSDSNDSLMSEFSELAAQLSEKTDGVKFKEECIRFLTTKVSANSMWLIRKELKRLKRDKNYFKFGKLSPLAAGLMHDIFCQPLR